MTVVNKWCFPSLHLLQCEQTGTAHRIVFVLCSVRLQPAACCHLPFFIHFFYVWLIKPPSWPTLTRQESLRKSRCTDRDALCVFLVGFGDREIRYGFFHVVIARGASSDPGGKRKSDRIVKPWERVIQITEVVEVFARKTNLRELENWKFDLQRKRDIFIFSRTTPDFHDFTLSLQLFPSLPYVATLQTKSRRPFLPKTRRRWPSSLAISC